MIEAIVGPELADRLLRDGVEDVEELYALSVRNFTKMYGRSALKTLQDGLQGTGLPELGEMTLVPWPSSQICMDCVHGCFLMVLPSSTYGCAKLVDMGPCETHCDEFEPKEESDND